MPAAPILMDEPVRLEALWALQVLDTPPEPRFDRLAALAQQLARTETAAISLVDADRQWFKAATGVDVRETPRDMAFCAHTILGDRVLWVEDARCDARFQDNPFVSGPYGVRFYAGAPIRLAGGERLGAVCVLGSEPKVHDPAVEAGLKLIAELAAEELQRSLAA